VQPYALKALPVAIIWLKLCWEMMTRNFEATDGEPPLSQATSK